jgi:Ca-activated chloride channel family protein
MTGFSSPILGLLALTGLVVWSLEFWKYFSKPQIQLPATHPSKGKMWITVRYIFFAVGIISWLLLGIALMGPQKRLDLTSEKIKAHDIFFVVDVSRSMLANDFEPNRLEAAKRKIIEFADLRPRDRIGLILFAEKVVTVLPLTTDLEVVRQAVGDIVWGPLGSGTNIGDALGLAVVKASQSDGMRKFAVLLTDGVNNVGNIPPLMAASEAAKAGLRVYTIGIAGRDDAKLPEPGPNGTIQYIPIPGGSIDLDTIRKISSITGAKSYVAKDVNALRDILRDIDTAERTEIEVHSRVVHDDRYFPFLLFGVVLFFLVEVSRRVVLREVN